MLGFKAFHSASATLSGIETAHMIRKGQLTNNLKPAHEQFMALAGELCLEINESEPLKKFATELFFHHQENFLTKPQFFFIRRAQ